MSARATRVAVVVMSVVVAALMAAPAGHAASDAELIEQARAKMRLTTVGRQIDDARVSRNIQITALSDTAYAGVCTPNSGGCYQAAYRTVYMRSVLLAQDMNYGGVALAHELTHALDDDITARYRAAYGTGYGSVFTEVRAYMVGAQVALGLGQRDSLVQSLVGGQLQSPQRIETTLRQDPLYSARLAANTVSVFSLVPFDSGHDTVDAIVRNWTKWSIPLSSSVYTAIPPLVDVDVYIYTTGATLPAWRWSGTQWEVVNLNNGARLKAPAGSTDPGYLKAYDGTIYWAYRKVARYSCTTPPQNRWVSPIRPTTLYRNIATGGAQVTTVPTTSKVWVSCGNAHRDASSQTRNLLQTYVQLPGSTEWKAGWIDTRDLVQR